MNDRIYKNDRPQLTIEIGHTKHLGNCYTSTVYKVTSWFTLHQANFDALRNAGFLGIGQRYTFKQVLVEDTKPDRFGGRPSGNDTVGLIEIDKSGNMVNIFPDRTIQFPYYVYEVVDYCDSSD